MKGLAPQAGACVVYDLRMGEWGFVGAAYGLVAAVLLVYGVRVERRLREIASNRSSAEGDRT